MARGRSTSVYFDRGTKEFSGISSAMMEEFGKAYPDADVPTELQRMKLWLMSPKGQKRKGNLAFVMKWLGNAHGKAPDRPMHVQSTDHETPLRPFLDEYLEEMWQANNSHTILALNRRTMT